MRATRLILVVLAIALLASSALWAQATSTITGTVKDESGGVIPGVEVTITNEATGDVRSALSGDSGNFRVTNLQSGDYEVRASLTGFQTATTRVAVTVGETRHLDLALAVGDVNIVIEVTDAATTVNVEQGRLSTLVDVERIKDLPLNGRNVYQLMQLAPGAVNTESTVDEPGQNTNVNGGRANMNGFWVDGITNKSLSGGTGAGDGAGLNPNLEAIKEFRIETLNFSAEFGGTVGSVVNVVTKSGGNEFHGSGYWFTRNDALDAREFFDAAEKPPFEQHQFGGSVGGPIVKEKTFFFATYEGTRIDTGESQAGTYESSAWANFAGQFGSPVAAYLYDNFSLVGDTVDQTVGQYLTDFGYLDSGATQADLDALLGSYFGSPAGALSLNDAMTTSGSFFAPTAERTHQFSVRIDQEIGDNDKLYGRYFFIDDDGEQPELSNRAAFNSPFVQRVHLFALNWTKIFNPTVVNEARLGFTRNITDIYAGLPGVPRISDVGSLTAAFGSYNGYPQIFHENIYTYADTLSMNKGDHGIKVGAEVRRNQENSEFNVGRPSYYFLDMIYLALDDPYYVAAGVNPHLDTGNAELESNFRGWRNWDVGFFVNDDWKVTPRLTLNLGLRWDFFSRLTEVQNRATAYQLGAGDYWMGIRNGNFTGPVDRLSESDWNNFAPRLGLAWDPTGSGKMSIRGGFGIAFQGAVYNPLANSRWNKPFYSFNGICDSRYEDACGTVGEVVLFGPQDGSAPRPDGANPNPGARNFEGNIIAYDPLNPNQAYLSGIPNPAMRDPYVMSFFVGIQREVMRDTTFEMNYVGTLGRKLIRAENPNRFNGDRLGWASPNGDFEGDTGFNKVNTNEGTLRFWENNVNSSYHALQTQLNRRFSSGVAFNASYTWAKSLDMRSTWHSGATSSNLGQEGYSTDISAIFLDYGRSVFDARHRMTASILLDTPWYKDSDNVFLREVIGGWQTNLIMALQSGQPWTPHCSRGWGTCDWNGDGNSNDRPMTPAVGNKISADRLDFVNPASVFNIPDTDGDGSISQSERIAYFGEPELGTTGNLGRNTYEGPGFANFDFSLFKEIKMPGTEESALQIRFEFFNVFNHPNFYQPQPRLNSSLFGQATEQFDAREIQIGLKYIF